jgi:hypothetical protein
VDAQAAGAQRIHQGASLGQLATRWNRSHEYRRGGNMHRSLILAVASLVLLLSACQPAAPTPTPEVFIPLTQAIPDYGITLEGVHLSITGATLSSAFPARCSGAAPACTRAKAGMKIVAVTLAPRDLPEGNMLAYKQLPDVRVAMEGGAQAPASLTQYDNASKQLTIGFEVPADARVFGLRWADLVEIPLRVETLQ